MKLTNGQIEGVANTINILNTREGVSVPVLLSFDLAIFASKLEPILNAISKQKRKIIQEFSSGEDSIGPDHENYEKAVAELIPLMGKENEIDFDGITREDLGSITGGVRPLEMGALIPIVVESPAN